MKSTLRNGVAVLAGVILAAAGVFVGDVFGLWLYPLPATMKMGVTALPQKSVDVASNQDRRVALRLPLSSAVRLALPENAAQIFLQAMPEVRGVASEYL